MALRYRPMRPKDVRECVEVIATHPVRGPRYGASIEDLRPAWLRLLGSDAMTAIVFEEAREKQTRICAVGVSVCVHDDFVRELKTRASFWAGPELARRVLRGCSPVLTDRQVREANSCCGMNLLVWEGCIHSDFEKNGQVHREIVRAFIEYHRGYLWKEVIASNVESVERLQWTIKTGGLLWDFDEARWVDSLKGDVSEIVRKPHVIGVTREIEMNRSGSWVGALFDYHPPRMGFSRGEQRLLLSALSHKTDEELSNELGKSLSTVKNMWRSIYNRAASCLPKLFSDHAAENLGSSERGKEKRRHLLTYLDEHPEELRPISRKLLREARQNQPLDYSF